MRIGVLFILAAITAWLPRHRSRLDGRPLLNVEEAVRLWAEQGTAS